VAKIDVILSAFPRSMDRVHYMNQTVAALKQRLVATEHELRWVCGSESQKLDENAKQAQEELCKHQGIEIVYNPGKPALGRNLNHVIGQTNGDYVFYVQDDWILNENIDLAAGVECLERNPDVSYIRYFWQQYKLHGEPNWIGDEFIALPQQFPHQFSHNPYLAPRRFYEQIGPFYEKTNAKNEELVNNKLKGLGLVVGARFPSVFYHVGQVSAMPDKYRGKLWSRLKIRDADRNHYDADHRASPAILNEIAKLLSDYMPQSILELGPGLSSMLFFGYKAKQYLYPDVYYLAMDHPSQYHDLFVGHLVEKGLDISATVALDLVEPDGFYDYKQLYKDNRLEQDRPIDFFFIDGPPAPRRRFNDSSLEFFRHHVGSNTMFILDDHHRGKEQQLAQALIKMIGGPVKTYKVDDVDNKRHSLVVIPESRKPAG